MAFRSMVETKSKEDFGVSDVTHNEGSEVTAPPTPHSTDSEEEQI